VDKALADNQSVKIRFLAAQIFTEAGQGAKAQKLANGLASELEAEPRAYAKIIAADLAVKRGDTREAIKALTEANTLLDTWIGHFELGRVYLQSGLFVEAIRNSIDASSGAAKPWSCSWIMSPPSAIFRPSITSRDVCGRV